MYTLGSRKALYHSLVSMHIRIKQVNHPNFFHNRDISQNIARPAGQFVHPLLRDCPRKSGTVGRHGIGNDSVDSNSCTSCWTEYTCPQSTIHIKIINF